MEIPIRLQKDVEKDIVLPIKVYSGNITQNKHWSWRTKYRKKMLMVLVSLLGKKAHAPSVKRRIRYIRYMGKREREYDENNFRWGLKVIEDIIVELNWLKDDSPLWYSGDYVQVWGETSALRIIIYYEGV